MSFRDQHHDIEVFDFTLLPFNYVSYTSSIHVLQAYCSTLSCLSPLPDKDVS